jgi:hypothetical protein
MPVFGPATASVFGAGELEGAAEAELGGDFDATEPGDAAGEAEGLESATPCGAGLGPAPGEGLSSSFGARAPMFAKSWPMRIFPKKTGRSKM